MRIGPRVIFLAIASYLSCFMAPALAESPFEHYESVRKIFYPGKSREDAFAPITAVLRKIDGKWVPPERYDGAITADWLDKQCSGKNMHVFKQDTTISFTSHRPLVDLKVRVFNKYVATGYHRFVRTVDATAAMTAYFGGPKTPPEDVENTFEGLLTGFAIFRPSPDVIVKSGDFEDIEIWTRCDGTDYTSAATQHNRALALFQRGTTYDERSNQVASILSNLKGRWFPVGLSFKGKTADAALFADYCEVLADKIEPRSPLSFNLSAHGEKSRYVAVGGNSFYRLPDDDLLRTFVPGPVDRYAAGRAEVVSGLVGLFRFSSDTFAVVPQARPAEIYLRCPSKK